MIRSLQLRNYGVKRSHLHELGPRSNLKFSLNENGELYLEYYIDKNIDFMFRYVVRNLCYFFGCKVISLN